LSKDLICNLYRNSYFLSVLYLHIKGHWQKTHSGGSSLCKRNECVIRECPILHLVITTSSLRLRITFWVLLTIGLILWSLLFKFSFQSVCHKSLTYSPIEALRSVYGILNPVIGNCNACFAAVSALVFPRIPIWLGIQQKNYVIPSKLQVYIFFQNVINKRMINFTIFNCLKTRERVTINNVFFIIRIFYKIKG
jgi:hypothetical protein